MVVTPSTSNYINSIHLNNLSVPDLSAFYARTEKPLRAGLVHGPIIRDCYIMQYVHTGRGILKINDNSFDITTGQCFMTFPKALVTMIADKDEPWGKSWVCMYGNKISTLLSNVGITETSPIVMSESCPELLEEIHRQIDILNKDNPYFEFDQAICANNIFKLIYKHRNHSLNPSQLTETKEEYVQRAIAYIQYNFNRKITVNDIASHVGLNRTYLSVIFKECTGISPQDFIHKHKIAKACDFFTIPNSTVASVAYSIGYEPRSFIRLFKQITGVTPNEYKNIVTKQNTM